MSEVGRRQFIVGAAVVASAMRVSSDGYASTGGGTSPAFRTFSEVQGNTYAAWCDLLAGGAAAAGVAHFADKYLSGPYEQSLLLSRFLVTPPLSGFYLAGIAGIDQESQARFGGTFLSLGRDEQVQIVDVAAQSKTQAWSTPDPFLFYLASRSDAVDVVYGTEQGFESLGYPYQAHILPTKPW